MKRIFPILFFCSIHFFSFSQILSEATGSKYAILNAVAFDTLRSPLIDEDPPIYLNGQLKSENSTFCNKMARATKYVMGYNLSIGLCLILAPEHISKWERKDKFQAERILKQYRQTYTSPPVTDGDLWMINCVGHPYQGSFYYNSVRSQGAKVWQSAIFCVGQTLVWEYGWEGGMEQPSVQDLIVTPVAGVLFGELSHFATVKMSRNGFRWYEVALVCILNPNYAINNGFSKPHQKQRKF
jgi:hypothetical protein